MAPTESGVYDNCCADPLTRCRRSRLSEGIGRIQVALTWKGEHDETEMKKGKLESLPLGIHSRSHE